MTCTGPQLLGGIEISLKRAASKCISTANAGEEEEAALPLPSVPVMLSLHEFPECEG